MTTENFDLTLRAFQRRKPFQPFTVELVSGDRFQVDHPEALVFRDGVGIFVARGGVPTIFDHEGVSQFIGEPLQQSALNVRLKLFCTPCVSAASPPPHALLSSARRLGPAGDARPGFRSIGSGFFRFAGFEILAGVDQQFAQAVLCLQASFVGEVEFDDLVRPLFDFLRSVPRPARVGRT